MYIHYLKIRKTTEHNEQEQSEFSVKNIVQATQSFFSLNCFKFKEIYEMMATGNVKVVKVDEY